MDLSSYNKPIIRNVFAVPVLIPPFRIFDWSAEDVYSIDIKTRKILTTAGNFHRNSDVDEVYLSGNEGGGGLRSVSTVFECHMLPLRRRY